MNNTALKDFEKNMSQIEEITNSLDSGTQTLSDSLEKYKIAVGLINDCQKALDQVKQTVETLNSDGNLIDNSDD